MVRPHPALLMFISFRHAEERIVAAIQEAGYDDITLAQARLMARVGPDGTRLTDLAEQAQVTKQTAGQMVDQLVRMGYAERRPDPSDGRARLVCIAARGLEVQEVARRTEKVLEWEWAAHLGKERMAALREALEDLREVTDPYA
ncbi:MarR family winged helix-turn-helix transcriptional regulator [Nocardioides speluncae]|uniref:MarR family winged helix-turn-helix transcriptional regulator n=1 Tax=Nocardioides speluncae TaxID=2670337 RepID=UPI000D69A681|nr:MarR family transcriptional regulator [Nocardioides speluncae]